MHIGKVGKCVIFALQKARKCEKIVQTASGKCWWAEKVAHKSGIICTKLAHFLGVICTFWGVLGWWAAVVVIRNRPKSDYFWGRDGGNFCRIIR